MEKKSARKSDSSENESDDADRSSDPTQEEEATDSQSEGSDSQVGNVRKAGRSGSVQASAIGGTSSGQKGSSHSSGEGYVNYERGSDPGTLSARYGLDVRGAEAGKLQRLEREFGRERVGRWAEEGMTVETMGRPRDMQAFRVRQEERSDEIPTDIERRNEASLQRNAAQNQEDGPAGEAGVPDVVRSVISSPGRSMDEPVQREMESKMGGDFSDVQVHTGPKAAAAADSINARAFTVGSHVAFNSGEYQPDSDSGKKVLAHELTHVRQQAGTSVSLLSEPDGGHPHKSIIRDDGVHIQPKLKVSSPDDPAEREAERVANAVMELAPSPDAVSAGSSQPARRREGTTEESERIRETAAEGVTGRDETLPHLDRLQSKFPGHDLSSISAHTGQAARKANEKIGSEAYATGSHVAFRDNPDLETTAHEVTHVIQQRGSIQLQDGVGSDGDRYEREADLVARRVARSDEPAVKDTTESSAPDRGEYVQLQESDQAPAGVNPEEDKALINLPKLEEGITVDLPVMGPTTFTGLDALMAALQVYPPTSLSMAPFNAARAMAMATGTTNALGVSADAGKGVEVAAGWGIAFPPSGAIATYGTLGGGGGIGVDDLVAFGASATADYTFVWGGLSEFSGPCYVIEFGAQAGYGGELSFIVGTQGATWTPEALSGAAVGVGVGVEAGVAARAEHTWSQLVVDQARGKAEEEKEKVLDEESGEVKEPEDGGGSTPPAPEEDGGSTTSAPEEDGESGRGGGVKTGTPLLRYEVEAGDTLAGIAKAHDVTGGWQRLYYDIKQNKQEIGKNPNLIHPGDTVWIPIE